MELHRDLQLCPICKEKYLVGRHESACMDRYPMQWINYPAELNRVNMGRMGRCETAMVLGGARVG